MTLSDVCLSVAYIGPKSRTERPRKTKIGTEVAHVTRDWDTNFKVKRSRSPGCFVHRRVGESGGCSGGRGNVLAVGNCCYVAVCSTAQGASASTGEERGGAYRGGRPPTACYCATQICIARTCYGDVAGWVASWLTPSPIPNSKGNPFSGGVKYTGGRKNWRFSCNFRRKSP